MRILWICGLPDEVRLHALGVPLSSVKTAAWSWILGHLPPPEDVELHILCPVIGLQVPRRDFNFEGAAWHCFRHRRFEQVFLWGRFLLQIRKFVRELRPDVIHGWGGETGCGWLATLLTSEAVVSVQGLLRLLDAQAEKFSGKADYGFGGRITRLIEWFTYLRAKMRLVESGTSQFELKRHYNRESRIVPHPLRKTFLLENHSETRKQCRLLFVGELTHRKGAVDFIEALHLGGLHDVEVVMVGDGDARQSVVEFLAQYSLSGQVKMISACSGSEIRELMESSDLFVLPSYGDTGPTVLKEAISQGLYPICYDNTGPAELIRRYCGCLVPTGRVDELAKAIVKTVGELRSCREKAVEASSVIKTDLSGQSIWKQLKDVYGAVV